MAINFGSFAKKDASGKIDVQATMAALLPLIEKYKAEHELGCDDIAGYVKEFFDGLPVQGGKRSQSFIKLHVAMKLFAATGELTQAGIKTLDERVVSYLKAASAETKGGEVPVWSPGKLYAIEAHGRNAGVWRPIGWDLLQAAHDAANAPAEDVAEENAEENAEDVPADMLGDDAEEVTAEALEIAPR